MIPSASITAEQEKPRLVKVSDSTWRIEGALCKCGGELIVDRCGRAEFLYETYCTKCLKCDENGWPTLKECLENSPAHFMEDEDAPVSGPVEEPEERGHDGALA